MKDREIARLIAQEEKRQLRVTNLIASENDVSPDVLTALGSVFTNKYAEGYPGRRYYGGNTIVDQLEALCQARALACFGLSSKRWHVNVQPLSGSPANLAVYAALVPLGSTIMGMSLAHGGHLTHGHKVSFTGMAWKQEAYGVDPKTERIDYDDVMRRAMATKPAIIVAGFTAYPRSINWKKFRAIADACGAYLMVDMSHIAGLVAGHAYPSPFPYADIVTTTTHKTLRGPRGAMIFARKDDRALGEKIDKAVFPGLQGGPHENAIAGIAVALHEAVQPKFRIYAKQVIVNARALGTELAKRGWRVVSGGTDSHLLLVDVWQGGAGVTGAEASARLEAAGIIVNKNTIPGETRSAFDPSGIRIGTACVTTRGAKERDMIRLGERIDRALRGAS